MMMNNIVQHYHYSVVTSCIPPHEKELRNQWPMKTDFYLILLFIYRICMYLDFIYGLTVDLTHCSWNCCCRSSGKWTLNIEQQFLPGEDVTYMTKIVSPWNYMMIRCSKFYGEVKESCCKTFSSPLLLMVERKIIHKSFGHFHLINIIVLVN